MLQTLLWRCPLCKTQDSIKQTERRFRHDLVDCRACKAQWELKRVPGGPDFRMRLIKGNETGLEKPLAKWYDQILEEIAFEPVDHPAWPISGVTQADEILYLHSPVIRGMASPNAEIIQKMDSIGTPTEAQAGFGFLPFGPGQLFFTSERLIFTLTKGASISFPWGDIRTGDAMMDVALNVGFGEANYMFVLQDQSVLKWLTYIHLIIKESKDMDHEIHLGNL